MWIENFTLLNFRKEISNMARGGRHERGYTKQDLQQACQTLTKKMKNNRIKLKIDKHSDSS